MEGPHPQQRGPSTGRDNQHLCHAHQETSTLARPRDPHGRRQNPQGHSVRGAGHRHTTHRQAHPPLQRRRQTRPESRRHRTRRVRSSGSRPQCVEKRCPVSNQDIRVEERAAVGGEERTQTTESRDSTVGRQRPHLQHLQQDLSFENRALQPQPALQLNNRLDQGAISIVSRDRRMPTTTIINHIYKLYVLKIV